MFEQPPGFNVLQQGGSTVVWLTDHYVEAYYADPFLDASIFRKWNDSTNTWVWYATALTGENTHIITQIASSQSIQNGGGIFGPSEIYGIDNVGHIFVLAPAGGPPPR